MIALAVEWLSRIRLIRMRMTIALLAMIGSRLIADRLFSETRFFTIAHMMMGGVEVPLFWT